jgi:hypothetical protein
MGVAQLEATGVAAADLRAPSAQIARVKAERQALGQATKKLVAALEARGVAHDDAEKLAASATVADQRFGSDGSVELKLILPTKELHLKK